MHGEVEKYGSTLMGNPIPITKRARICCTLIYINPYLVRMSPRQSVLDDDMPIPPYMPMQSSASRKSESLERKIKKKKEKEGCKQQ